VDALLRRDLFTTLKVLASSTADTSVILFCDTNAATEYTRISCDLLKYRETCSDLENALIRKYGFTLKTGVTVGLDSGHEKYVVNLIRDTNIGNTY
jgi:hypothetical protein